MVLEREHFAPDARTIQIETGEREGRLKRAFGEGIRCFAPKEMDGPLKIIEAW